MTMLVTKFSNGKYRNEIELFDQPISKSNVKLMGEMIALQALRTVKRFDFNVADKLYIGLIKDLHHMNEVGHIISEGYDCAQTAMRFLWQFAGRTVHEIYGKDKKELDVTIKSACYREVSLFIEKLRRKSAKTKYIDFTDYRAYPMDPVNCFEKEEPDYSKADAILEAMQLTEAETETLNCYMNGMTQSEAALFLAISIAGVKYRKMRIRQKYLTYIGSY